MELTGDPVLDFMEALFDYIDRHRGVRLSFPPNFASYPEADQRIWLRNLYEISIVDPIPTDIMPARVKLASPTAENDLHAFIFDNGPRPPITG